MQNAVFDTDLTEAQWAYLEPFLPKPARTGRPRTPLRRVLNAIFYVLKSGCQWRLLPGSFPPWRTIFHRFRRWCLSGLLATVHDRLRAYARETAGRRSRPTAAILDSQTVRSAGLADQAGYDGAKMTKGRKRFVLVDSLGHLLALFVCPASVAERAGGKTLLEGALGNFRWLRKLWVDSGFSGPDFAQFVATLRPKLDVEVVPRPPGTAGFKVLPKRWIVERTFGWLMQHRRLVRDYERSTSSVTAWIHLAMIRIMLRRLA